MFHKKFVTSGDLMFARSDFERFKDMVEEFTGLTIKVFDVVPERSKTTFYYELVKFNPEHNVLLNAHSILSEVKKDIKEDCLKDKIQKAMTLIEGYML